LPEDTQSEAKISYTEDGSIEFNAFSRNAHGTGFDMIVSNPVDGFVDIEIFQVVCHEVPTEPSVSLSLPVSAAVNFMLAFQGGTNVALQMARLKRYH